MVEIVGLECKATWCSKILSNEKSIETRSYPLPENYLGKKLWLISSGGQDGVSSVPDSVPKGYQDLDLVGWIVVSHVKEYHSQASWDADAEKHCVPEDTPYSWQKGATRMLYGWVIREHMALPKPKSNPRMKRLFRSLFVLEQ